MQAEKGAAAVHVRGRVKEAREILTESTDMQRKQNEHIKQTRQKQQPRSQSVC